MPINPSRVKLPPEALPETVVKSLTTSVTTLAEYILDPYFAHIESIYPVSSVNANIAVAIDGRAESMRLNCLATDSESAALQKLVARRTIAVTANMNTGTSTFAARWGLVVRSPTIVEKIRLGMSLTDQERTIAESLALEDQLSLGLVPYPPLVMSGTEIATKFDHIEESSFNLGVLGSDSSTQIGPTVTVPLEHVYYLLGVRLTASGASWPVSASDDTFLVINRDDDAEYVRLDLAALSDEVLIRMMIPFVNKMSVTVESDSGTGTDSIYASLIIGKRPATVIDHIRWGYNLPYGNAFDRTNVETLIDKYKQHQLIEKVMAGVI